ncbi:MAG TPA: sigma-54 dependent transcriptional regulator [Phycisphaerae bacterium]|nr:sigma-54 dependent transcriptional regulator [Phycisphaerae bacterium]
MDEQVLPNVMVVTRVSETARVVLEVLASRGVRGTVAADLKAAGERLQSFLWGLVFVELESPDGREFQLLRKARESLPETPVVMISGRPAIETAVRAMREGCHDFLPKPLDRGAVERLVDTLLPNHQVPLAASAQQDSRCLFLIAGESPDFLRTIRLATRAAPTSVPVLITGESGTGKELVSYLVHRRSRRSSGPYIHVNCAALSESLLESELFGHERGAFTGAYARRKGRFERAHGGTLLLDEISETTPRLQAELLRVLEQQDFERVGGSESVRVNVRVISTSNRDLTRQVDRKRFRLDLYYRLGGVHLHVAPLRQRAEDIPTLVWHFVNLHAGEVRRQIRRLDPEMLELFSRCSWPGNVRQLRNVVRAALVLGEGPVLDLSALPALRAELEAARPAEKSDGPTLRLRELERRAVLEALRRTQRNQTKAALLLGITDRTLREKLRRYREQDQLQPAGEQAW